MTKENRRTVRGCHVILWKDSESTSEQIEHCIDRAMVRRLRRKYVRLEGQGHPDRFDNLSELVLGEGESRGYQKMR